MTAVEIHPLNIQSIKVSLIGDSPLISNNPETAMLELENTAKSKARGQRDPDKKFQESLYCMPPDAVSEFGFPAAGFKKAIVRAAKQIPGMTMIDTKGDFHIVGSLVPIFGKPELMKSMVRVGRGAGDIRYRATFKEWASQFVISYDQDCITVEQILNLMTRAGFKVGVGDWRPERDGNYGRFRVAQEGDVDSYIKRFGR